VCVLIEDEELKHSQFTIHLHFDASQKKQYPLTVILRSHPLSARNPQIRFVARGTGGTFVKYGLDVQEEQLKEIQSPKALLHEKFGLEPEYLWGTLEKLEADNITTTKSMCVIRPAHPP